MAWTTRETTNDRRLDPNDNIDKGDTYLGRYLGAFERSGEYGTFTLHRFLDQGLGGSTSSAISRVLDNKLRDVQPGTLVRLTYLGKNLDTRNGRAHNWQVETDDDDIDESVVPAREAAPVPTGRDPHDDF